MAETENEQSQKAAEKKKHKKYTVLDQHLGGGPHGLGDPDDKTLRKVEKDILITEKIRQESRKSKCVGPVRAFGECAKEAGLLLPFKCRKENTELKECLSFWFQDEELRKQCTEEYLRDRSQFRRTGIPAKKYNRITKTLEPNTDGY